MDRALDKDNLQIKPDSFAQAAVSANKRLKKENDLHYLKRQLKLYAAAVYMAEDFNRAESASNKKLKHDQVNRLQEKLIERRLD
ncbi:MAG: hypothetical protein ABF703_04590 [Oenococcus sp.]|uniref:hypothetical protein n=1 Tax=Oenococcus TaxID=46254 RepID=UPI0021E84664|nr:hypothetical protein [Oenococcus kitaharae]MCV3297160.1 hypothetical protein [Oenococcus kitaharae]